MGITLLGVGFFVCYQGWELSLGKPSAPGPGFVPFGLGLVLLALTAVYLFQIRRGEQKRKGAEDRGGFRRLAAALGVICFFALAVSWLGYLPTTFLLFLIWLSAIEKKSLAKSFSVAFAAVAAVYLFNTLFSVQLPPGLLKGLVR